ncbi:Ileal sodium/bile acid cotransporter [Seminavis robusta]|uniref:Ileal sodium/bile acid cotransporter n=1 Tax=Seminavis robusta TaxID=568900 RepID=A0A9N8EEM9_9STRA|nr:Ileal sodium/bile acid cotransporter [Seminavis robusta]|eukprot:Sro881_g215230.1 Ileal sodium/bile acid cotransporter (396) ;mRNA; f:22723-23910
MSLPNYLRWFRNLQEPPLEEEQVDDDNAVSMVIELVLGLAIFLIMIAVGSSCKWELVKKMFSSPKALKAAAVGVTCQFLVMPAVAYALTKIFALDGYMAFGAIIAATMPGGGISNIYTMWGQGILELSVFMTIVSTIVSFGMTPLWIYIFSNFVIDFSDNSTTSEPTIAIDQIAISLVMLLVPLSIGVSLNFCSCTNKIRPILEKGIHVLAILFLMAAIVALLVQYHEGLADFATWQLGVSAFIYFPIATGLSYGITTLLKFSPAARRTVVFEVGLQNLALALAIGEQALKYKWQREQAIPFPLLYAIFMYCWAGLLVPVFRRQRRVNEEQGNVDCDPDFFVVSENCDEADDVALSMEFDTSKQKARKERSGITPVAEDPTEETERDEDLRVVDV